MDAFFVINLYLSFGRPRLDDNNSDEIVESLGKYYFILQVTFSEKETKITPQTHIRKFEILYFSDNISKVTGIQNFFCSEKSTTSIYRENCSMESIS